MNKTVPWSHFHLLCGILKEEWGLENQNGEVRLDFAHTAVSAWWWTQARPSERPFHSPCIVWITHRPRGGTRRGPILNRCTTCFCLLSIHRRAQLRFVFFHISIQGNLDAVSRTRVFFFVYQTYHSEKKIHIYQKKKKKLLQLKKRTGLQSWSRSSYFCTALLHRRNTAQSFIFNLLRLHHFSKDKKGVMQHTNDRITARK